LLSSLYILLLKIERKAKNVTDWFLRQKAL